MTGNPRGVKHALGRVNGRPPRSGFQVSEDGRVQNIPQPDAIPVALRQGRRWVGWRPIERRTGKPGKVPIDPATGRAASPNDPATWNTFDIAIEAVERFGLAGVGRVVAADDRLAFLDLDGCRDHRTGIPDPWAEEILAAFGDTYAEISPSGTGYRAVVAGLPPANMPCRVGLIELYSRDRYLTITGRRVESHPVVVADARDRLRWLAEHFLRRPEIHPADVRVREPGLIVIPDAELLARATAHHRTGMRLAALLRGETLDHRSQSEADYELARLLGFWCGGDEERVIRLMRASGAARDKYDRRDYLPRTVSRAVARLSRVYSPATWPKPDPLPHTPTCVDKSVSLPTRSVDEQADRLIAHIRAIRNRTRRPVGLAARQAKDVIGSSSATAARRLNELVQDGRLILLTKGTNANRLASAYDLPEFVTTQTASLNPSKSSAKPTGPAPYALTPSGSLGVWRWSVWRGEWRHFGDCPCRDADAVAGRLMARWPGWWSIGGELRRYSRGRGLRIMRAGAR
jgi:hypothetical protein